jgi:hypothetical protein
VSTTTPCMTNPLHSTTWQVRSVNVAQISLLNISRSITQRKVIRVLASHWGSNGYSQSQIVGINNTRKKKRDTEVTL